MSSVSLSRIAFLSVLLVSGLAVAADWPRFRGPNGGAVSDDRNTPVKWSASENIVWRTPLPGPGTSSPITTGEQKGFSHFVTLWGSVSTPNNPGDPGKLERVLVCLDEITGKVLWQKEVKGVANEDRFGGYLTSHGYASSTPATDGERVYVLFGKAGVVAYDLDGKELWHKSVGTGSAIMGWGSAASPIVYKNLVIVNAAAESTTIYAFDGKTGKEVWKSPADSLSGCWGTPLLVDVPGGKTEMALAVAGEIWGFDPENGKFLWFCESIPTQAICTSLVARDGIVYEVVGGPGGGGAAAVKAGGRDDVTKTHVLWSSTKSKSYITSPVLAGDYLYWVNDDGFADCISRKTGEQVYHQRMPGAGRQYAYASIMAAGDKLYAVTEEA